MTEPLQDHDSPWKEALENRFAEFLELLFSEVHREIDWSRERTFLDKELQKLTQDAELGRRYADKLVKVWSNEGRETWVLIHVEVQGEAQQDFARRMYIYHYRISDRYSVDVVSLGVLADTVVSFRPDGYRWQRWGCTLDFCFPTVKLLDWLAAERWQQLERSENIFALVVMAQLAAKTEADLDILESKKFRLIKLLYDRGYSKEIILELFRVIDWMIRLPDNLEDRFLDAVHKIEEDKKMPYVTSAERRGIKIGMQQGEASLLLRQMGRKYGSSAADSYRQKIEQADPESLLKWSERILTADTAEEIFH